MGKPSNLDKFREQHDPTFLVAQPEVFSRKLRKGCKNFIIVAAQNGTPVEADWWRVIRRIAEHRKAEILVLPVRYKNPTSQWSASQQGAEWWPEEVRDYLWSASHSLNKKVMVLGDFKIQPTASDPLTGAEALSLAASGIIGHTKLQMKSVATPASRMAKILTTTGACTVANYTDSRAGRISAFHHSLSCVIVELAGDTQFHLRHIHFDKKTKSATDLSVRYTLKGATCAPRPLAIVMGDTHVRAIDPAVERATFGPDGMIEVLNPEYVIFHDVLDSYLSSPHHLADPFIGVAIAKTGQTVEDEVQQAIKFIKDRTTGDRISVVVGSNHNDMLGRWLKRADWKLDPLNARFYLRTALRLAEEAVLLRKGADYPDPFATLVADRKLPNVRVLDEDESFMLGGVELGMHGHRGPNGARGSARNLRRIGVKSVIGHSHSPAIDEGCYQTGTSTLLRLDYNKGPSSWLNAHCIVHADGKRQIVIIVDGRWRA